MSKIPAYGISAEELKSILGSNLYHSILPIAVQRKFISLNKEQGIIKIENQKWSQLL
jgi:hypothetical protein